MSKCLCKARVAKDCICGKGDKPHYTAMMQTAVDRMRSERVSEIAFLEEICSRLRLALTEKDEYLPLFYEVRRAVEDMEVFLDP